MQNIVKAAGSPVCRIPDDVAVLLENPPLWRGESREDYLALLHAIAKSVGAKDVVDWLCTDEVTYHVWEILRIKRIAAAIILSHQIAVVEELLKSTYDPKDGYSDMIYAVSDARNEARRWATDPEFGKKLDERLAARGHDTASIQAKAYTRCAGELDRIEKSIAKLEVRRMTTLREIARRNEALAKRIERASLDIIDGEFSEAAE
jgi:hypothetical protein